MHGLKRLRSTLDIKTNCIYHAISAGESLGDRLCIMDICFDRFKLGTVGPGTTRSCDADVSMQRERITRAYADAELPGGQESRSRQTQRQICLCGYDGSFLHPPRGHTPM